MIDLIEKTMLAGFGALSLTQKKSEELLSELKERIDLTEEEGKQFLNRLQELARENQKKLEEAAREEINKVGKDMGFVPREEFEALEKKVSRLEKQLKAKP